MKTKINLTIEKDIVRRAKIYAKENEKSVSQLVEDMLMIILNQNSMGTEHWLDRWQNNYIPEDYQEPPAKELIGKYREWEKG